MFHFLKASSSVNRTRHLSITKSHKYSSGIFNFGIDKSVMGEVNMMFILTRSGYWMVFSNTRATSSWKTKSETRVVRLTWCSYWLGVDIEWSSLIRGQLLPGKQREKLELSAYKWRPRIMPLAKQRAIVVLITHLIYVHQSYKLIWPPGEAQFWSQGYYLNKFGSGPLGDATYQISRFESLWCLIRRFYHVFPR